jgi:hypothetical protein
MGFMLDLEKKPFFIVGLFVDVRSDGCFHRRFWVMQILFYYVFDCYKIEDQVNIFNLF